MSEVSVLVRRGIGWSIVAMATGLLVNLSSIVTLTGEISREPALIFVSGILFVRGGTRHRPCSKSPGARLVPQGQAARHPHRGGR